MRLIDVKELKEWIENWFEVNAYYHPYSKSNNIPIPELYDILKRMPTVDAEPVRRGHWINKGNYAICSECGANSGTQYNGLEPVPRCSRYCPNCGAKMDEV